MKKIIIDPHNCSREELAGLKKYLDDNAWDYKDENDEVVFDNTKDKKIALIKEIILSRGGTTTAELQADCSPCVYSSGTNKMNVSTLVEEFNISNVKIVTYNNETEIADDTIPYEDLTEDIIDEILILLEDYDITE